MSRIYICGYGAKGRIDGGESTGKDYAAEKLRDMLGYTFESSSYFAAKHFLFDLLKEEKGYETLDECFADRHSEGMRKRWFDEISKFNEDDPTRLSAAIFDEHQIYVGLRSADELLAAQERWDDLLCIWIDASERVEPENTDSCTVTAEMCDFTVLNNGSIEEYDRKIEKLARLLR